MINKICPICKKEFIPHNGMQKYCSKECSKIAAIQLAEKYHKKYYLKNHKKIIERVKKYYQKHKLECNKKTAEYYQKNKEKINQQKKIYYKTHELKTIKYQKEYYQEHRYESNEVTKRYMKKLYHIDVNFKLRTLLRNRIWYALKNNQKSETTMKLIGCSLDFLKQYLEKQFKPGMNWENYGKWHVDHILPCASFDLSKPKEQRKCFNYTNLQPLWAEENLSKHDKIISFKEK